MDVNHHRYYNPKWGRYMEPDPIGLEGGLNPFVYSNNDPINKVDPSGLGWKKLIGSLFDDILAPLGREAVKRLSQNSSKEAAKQTTSNQVKNTAAKVEKDVPKTTSKDVAENVTKRPSGFRKQTVQNAWDNAADGSKVGTKACPTCDKNVGVAPGQGRRDWDVDHQPKWKDRNLVDMDRKQVLDEYNRNIRLRCSTCNRSDN